MHRPERPPEVRGARDLVALWRALPAAGMRYPAAALPPGLGLSALTGILRARAWRDHCASASPASCAETGRTCAQANSGRCRADALFPFRIGGGTPKWRMATLTVQWRPVLGQLRLIALGETACGALDWAVRCLREHHGLKGRGRITPGSYADIVLFDLDRIRVIGDPTEPRRYPEGIEHVFVNGAAVVEDGEHTGATPGKIIKRASQG